MTTFETALLQFTENKVYNFYLHVPKTIGDQYANGLDRRVVCSFVQSGKKIQTGLVPYSEGYFILINQPLLKELNLQPGESITINIQKDESEYGMPMPEELDITLKQDIEAREYFLQLTEGKKRNLIYIVNQVKNTDSRLRKSLAIAAHLVEVQGKLNFKMLNEKIKEFNQQRHLKP
ncbi:YdeI/OmpD-associated family protein [Marinoscillum sp. MHG1-6]|uniref:YdeI/OmpD-associated family protein n=1 Tax=Marinoscillum sp. MHG1-6 TaxID=2959627 RepID=UPI00215858BC|nr:YdeI/OmpD-associated family protein [Marinoscillum sp. MHG1-6]